MSNRDERYGQKGCLGLANKLVHMERRISNLNFGEPVDISESELFALRNAAVRLIELQNLLDGNFESFWKYK